MGRDKGAGGGQKGAARAIGLQPAGTWIVVGHMGLEELGLLSKITYILLSKRAWSWGVAAPAQAANSPTSDREHISPVGARA